MNNKELFCRMTRVGLTSVVVVFGALTGCVGYVDRTEPRHVHYAPPPVQATVVVEDDYVYYPSYEVYYSSRRHQYAYRDGGAWVSRPAPRGVSVDLARVAAQAWLSRFIQEMKASGFIADALQRHGIQAAIVPPRA